MVVEPEYQAIPFDKIMFMKNTTSRWRVESRSSGIMRYVPNMDSEIVIFSNGKEEKILVPGGKDVFVAGNVLHVPVKAPKMASVTKKKLKN